MQKPGAFCKRCQVVACVFKLFNFLYVGRRHSFFEFPETGGDVLVVSDDFVPGDVNVRGVQNIFHEIILSVFKIYFSLKRFSCQVNEMTAKIRQLRCSRDAWYCLL